MKCPCFIRSSRNRYNVTWVLHSPINKSSFQSKVLYSGAAYSLQELRSSSRVRERDRSSQSKIHNERGQQFWRKVQILFFYRVTFLFLSLELFLYLVEMHRKNTWQQVPKYNCILALGVLNSVSSKYQISDW